MIGIHGLDEGFSSERLPGVDDGQAQAHHALTIFNRGELHTNAVVVRQFVGNPIRRDADAEHAALMFKGLKTCIRCIRGGDQNQRLAPATARVTGG